MGLFGKKKNDMTKINETSKQQIISQLTTIMRNSRGEATAMLKDIQLEMQSHGASDSIEVAKRDALITKLLGEINAAVVKGQDALVVTKLRQVKTAVAERKINCTGGGQLTKADAKAAKEQAKLAKKLEKQGIKVEQTRSESLEETIANETAKLADLQKTMEDLKARYQKNPNDRSIISQANTIKMQIQATKERINSYEVELQRENLTTSMQQTVEDNANLVQGRTVSDDQIEVLGASMDEANAARKQTMEQTQANMARFGQLNAFGNMGNPFEDSDSVSFANPFADDEGAVFGTGSTSQGTQQRQTQYGSFNAGEMGTQAMSQDIAKTKQSIEQAMDAYNDKMDDLSDDLADLNAQLKPLLLKRKNATPSECIILDGQIDQLNAKRNSVQYTIKRTRQALATLQEQMSLMDRLSTQQDLDATNAKIQQMTGGRFADFEGLAMFLKDSVAKSNEQLEEIGTASMVADSEEINMNTFSGSSAVFSDTMGNKDEDRYADLERDLGLMN